MRQRQAERRNPTVEYWLAITHHRSHRGERLDFSRHSYQVAILKDQAQHVAIRKSTQCGVSEIHIVHAMACADQGRSVFWVFPDERLRNVFVKDRIDPSLSASPYYAALVARAKSRTRKGKDASDEVALKQIGTASIALVGSNSEASFKSFSADDAIIDEVDQCDQRHLAMVPDRLAASAFRTQWHVGNPTIAGVGIDRLYGESDQKRWFVTCPHCGERQELDWFANVVREVSEGIFEPRAAQIEVTCRKCEGMLDRLAKGEWVAEHPDRDVSGYHISQLFSGSVTIAEMWGAFQKGLRNETELMRFYNSVLGLPYSGKGARLSEAYLDAAVGDHPQVSSGRGCYVGIDVGKQNHVIVIADDGRVISIQAVETFSQCENILSQFHAQLCVIDALPETRKARELAESLPGQVLLCFYTSTDQVEDFVVDYDAMEVRADRTQTMDESHGAILAKKAILPRDASGVPDFYAHMGAPTRIYDKSNPNPARHRFRWTEGLDPDHYRHAFNYAWMARGISKRTGQYGAWVIG